MVKKFVYAVNSIPFAGKITIRPFAYRYWTATTISRKFTSFLGLAIVLIFFIFSHGSQTYQGFQAFSQNEHIFLNFVFISYGLVNFAVTIAQAYLLFRAVRHLSKKLPKTTRRYVDMKFGSTIVHMGVTLLGQIIFLVAYYLSLT